MQIRSQNGSRTKMHKYLVGYYVKVNLLSSVSPYWPGWKEFFIEIGQFPEKKKISFQQNGHKMTL